MFSHHFECGQEPGGELRKNMAGLVGEDCFSVKLSLILGIMNRRKEEFLNSRKTLQKII